MAIDSSWGSTHFHRNEIFNTMLKEPKRDDIFAQNWVNFIGDFPDGSNYKINSIGELTIDQMAEGVALPDRRPDSGQYVFNINEFVGTKVGLTDVFFEEDFMANQVLASIPDRMTRGMDEYMETAVCKLQRKQTANDSNTINSGKHRFTADGTGAVMTVNDLAYVVYTMKKSGVGAGAMIGLVDPAFEFNTNVSSQVLTSFNPQYEGIITSGIGSGYRFIRNIMGIDIYTTNYLDALTSAESSLTDYAGNTTAGSVGYVANMFFSASDRMNLPFIGAWRRRPRVESWKEYDKGIEYHQMSARFGLDLYRPENLVVCLTSQTLS